MVRTQEINHINQMVEEISERSPVDDANLHHPLRIMSFGVSFIITSFEQADGAYPVKMHVMDIPGADEFVFPLDKESYRSITKDIIQLYLSLE